MKALLTISLVGLVLFPSHVVFGTTRPIPRQKDIEIHIYNAQRELKLESGILKWSHYVTAKYSVPEKRVRIEKSVQLYRKHFQSIQKILEGTDMAGFNDNGIHNSDMKDNTNAEKYYWGNIRIAIGKDTPDPKEYIFEEVSISKDTRMWHLINDLFDIAKRLTEGRNK